MERLSSQRTVWVCFLSIEAFKSPIDITHLIMGTHLILPSQAPLDIHSVVSLIEMMFERKMMNLWEYTPLHLGVMLFDPK